MTDLVALAESLADATLPDRGLDIRLYRLDPVATTDGLNRLAAASKAGLSAEDSAWSAMVPRYTGIIDAALRLVQRALPGWSPTICIPCLPGTDKTGARSVVHLGDFRPDDPDEYILVEAEAASPALALCLAFVRANLAVEADDEF